MNILQALNEVRTELQSKDLPKSGFNKFAGFKYYELKDFLPTINELNKKYGIISLFSMGLEIATLTIKSVENPEDYIVFELKVVDAKLKGATEIQEHGATSTYMKRYLYLNAYEIVEGEVIDAQKQDTPQENNEKAEYKTTNTSTKTTDKNEKATKEQVNELKALAKRAGISDEKMFEKYTNFIYKTPFASVYNKAKADLEDYIKKNNK